MKKILSVICLVIVSVLLFSGCADVSFSVMMNEKGQIEQAMQVHLDKDEITLAGYDYTEVFNKVVDDFDDYLFELRNAVICYALVKGVSFDNCGIRLYSQNNKAQAYIFGSIVFDSIKIYREFYEITDTGDDDTVLDDSNWFYNREISEAETVFSSILEEGTTANDYASEYLTYFEGSEAGKTQKTLEDANFNYYYGMPTNKLHSNSDRIYRQNGITIHEWNFSASELNDKIQLYTIAVKPVAWYILALAITLIVVAVIIIIGLIQKKLKKDKNTIAQEQN